MNKYYNSKLIKKSISWFVFVLNILPVFGQIQFTAKINSSKLIINEPFTVTYTLSGGKADLFKKPQFNGFSILAQSSIMSNENLQKTFPKQLDTINIIQQSWTFTFIAQAVGEYIINPAKVKINNQWFASPSLELNISSSSINSNIPQPKSQNNIQFTKIEKNKYSHDKVKKISKDINPEALNKDDIFIKATSDKNLASIGEAIIITYTLYTKKNISSYTINKIPHFNGFWSENLIDNNAIPQKLIENINGETYTTAVLRKIVLYPQHSGKLTVDPLKAEIVYNIPSTPENRNDTSFADQMYRNLISNQISNNQGVSFQVDNSYIDIKKTIIKSNNINISVKSLPTQNKPFDFSGQVGKYSLESWIDKDIINIGEILTLFVKINGTGNLPLLLPPNLNIPSDFDVNEPNIIDQIKPSSIGQTGFIKYAYKLIPKKIGSYKLSAVHFSYYDLDLQDYKTIFSKEFLVKVIYNEQSVPIQTSELNSENKNVSSKYNDSYKIKSLFFNPYIFYFIVVLLLGIFIFLIFNRKRKSKDLLNDIQVNDINTSKIAINSLENISIPLSQDKTNDFYSQISIILCDYLSQKFSIQQADLSVDKVISHIGNFENNSELINSLKRILKQIEYNRFAPVSDSLIPYDFLDKIKTLIFDIEKLVELPPSKIELKV